MKHLFLAAVVSLSLAAPASAIGPEPSKPNAGLVILDVALVRPLGIAVSLAATAVGVGTAPLTWMMGLGEEATQVLVIAPWRFTAARWAGDFDGYYDERNAFGTSEYPERLTRRTNHPY